MSRKFCNSCQILFTLETMEIGIKFLLIINLFRLPLIESTGHNLNPHIQNHRILHPTIVSPGTCKSVDGDVCEMPFTYGGATYDSCTARDDPGNAWCYLANGVLAPTGHKYANCDLSTCGNFTLIKL